MPNFQTKLLNPLKYPYKNENISFEWIAKNDSKSLIFTRYHEEEFFLQQIQRKNSILVKSDKLAKPTCVKILQDALIEYKKATNSHEIYSNIQSRKNRIHEDKNVLKKIDFFANDFSSYCKNFKDIFIDVGFGSGRHLLFHSEQNPKNLYIGVEIHKPSIEQVIKQCKIRNIKNIILVDFDARVLMEFFHSNVIKTIFVHFPIPWDKKPHRRVICDEFLEQSCRVLKRNGTLELRTDSDKFFNYSLEIFLKQPFVKLKIGKNQDIAISSKYEDRWRKLEKNIYDLTLINQEKSLPIYIPRPLSFEFNVEKNSFKKETILKDGYFIHFQTCYNIDKDNFVWKVAFGDTACVENCYILVQNKKAKYFPKNIYATKHNINAHKIISERLSS